MSTPLPVRLVDAFDHPVRIAPAPCGLHRPCLECGAAFDPGNARRDFCCDPCRRGWNNRRALRGAEIYDLFMAFRFDRPLATASRAFLLMCRMAAQFRREDDVERDGRRSWRLPEEIVARRPYLLADRLASSVGR